MDLEDNFMTPQQPTLKDLAERLAGNCADSLSRIISRPLREFSEAGQERLIESALESTALPELLECAEALRKLSHAHDCIYWYAGEGWHRDCTCPKKAIAALDAKLKDLGVIE